MAPVKPVPPVLPVKPEAPVAPVSPVKPVAPVNPVKPVKPVAPVKPVDPVHTNRPSSNTNLKIEDLLINRDSAQIDSRHCPIEMPDIQSAHLWRR